MFAIGIFMYSDMPDEMPTHWNSQGDADGYSSRFIGLFLLPIISLGLFILFYYIPRISVYNINAFKKYYEYFITGFITFLVLLYIGTVIYAIMPFPFNYYIVPLIAALFYLIGYILKYCKRNYFIGIRTPWTLASENVWDKTHQVGSFVFRLIPFALLIGLLFPDYVIWLLLIAVLLNAAFFVLYSYWLYKKEGHPKVKIKRRKRKK